MRTPQSALNTNLDFTVHHRHARGLLLTKMWSRCVRLHLPPSSSCRVLEEMQSSPHRNNPQPFPTGCRNPRLKLYPGLQTKKQAGNGCLWGKFEKSLPRPSGCHHYPRWLCSPFPKGPLWTARLAGAWGRKFVHVRKERGERERMKGWGRGEAGGEGSKVEKKGICKIKRQGPIRWCWARKACCKQK